MHGADSLCMGTFRESSLNCIIRGAFLYVVWCYGGFVVGPLAVAWDRMFAIPLWIIVGSVALIPLLVEAGAIWASRTRASRTVSPVWSPAEHPCASAGVSVMLPSGWEQRRLRRVRTRGRNPMERFGRSRLRY